MTTILREAADTAARERARLEATTGRPRLAAVAGRIPLVARRLGSEDAARNGLRYQPVAWTLIVVAAVAFWFPGRSDSGDATAVGPVLPAVVAPPTTVAAQPVSPATDAPPGAVLTPPPSVRPLPSPSGGTTATTYAPSPPPPPSSTASAAPLSIRGFGWAASLSGTGLSTADVPEGTLPVANRLGQLDKASFVRLGGSATTLALTEDPGGAREAVGGAAVVVCPITDAGWVEGPDQSMDAAPPWDANACVAGTEAQADGTWTFDLSRFPVRDGDTGYAIVPDAAAPADFQITFRSS